MRSWQEFCAGRPWVLLISGLKKTCFALGPESTRNVTDIDRKAFFKKWTLMNRNSEKTRVSSYSSMILALQMLQVWSIFLYWNDFFSWHLDISNIDRQFFYFLKLDDQRRYSMRLHRAGVEELKVDVGIIVIKSTNRWQLVLPRELGYAAICWPVKRIDFVFPLLAVPRFGGGQTRLGKFWGSSQRGGPP